MILIKNGSIVIDNNLVKKDVLVDGNTIIKIEDNIDLECDILDAILGSSEPEATRDI